METATHTETYASEIAQETNELLAKLGVQLPLHTWYAGNTTGDDTDGAKVAIHTPIDGAQIGTMPVLNMAGYDKLIAKAQQAYEIWNKLPAPKRGDVIRQIGEKLRAHKADLGKLVSIECGKSYQEGLGEVQEMVDICEFAVGLSRQLYGLTMHSERPEHRMYEQYHPLGIVGVISAFNFPVAVWAWNAMLAGVCGNVTLWKPSEKTPLTAVASHALAAQVLAENNLPEGIFTLMLAGAAGGEAMAKDKRVALVSATGSTRMGRAVGQELSKRMGKALLELGGNNAIIITPSANMDLAMRAVVFGAVGTAGQRCTTTRRLIVHDDVYESVKEKLVKVYPNLSVGNPIEAGVLVGPLIDQMAVDGYLAAIASVQTEGGKLLVGGKRKQIEAYPEGFYVEPAIVEAKNEYATVQQETFAPILYLMRYSGHVANAVAIQNDVKQGLSSAIFTNDLRESEYFLSHLGSDCGIANVNIGTSGAEIGGAFGGEKETGGGRESGSDAWKVYMRRQTNTINYSASLPLAQGIQFDI